MQAAHGELVLAQVNDRVLHAHQRVLQHVLPFFERGVGIDGWEIILEDEQRFVGQRAAREEAAQVALARRKAIQIQICRGSGLRLPWGQQLHSQRSRLVKGAHKVQIAHSPSGGGIADKVHHHWLAYRPGRLQQPLGHCGRWRLGKEHDDLCLGVAAE